MHFPVTALQMAELLLFECNITVINIAWIMHYVNYMNGQESKFCAKYTKNRVFFLCIGYSNIVICKIKEKISRMQGGGKVEELSFKYKFFPESFIKDCIEDEQSYIAKKYLTRLFGCVKMKSSYIPAQMPGWEQQ